MPAKRSKDNTSQAPAPVPPPRITRTRAAKPAPAPAPTPPSPASPAPSSLTVSDSDGDASSSLRESDLSSDQEYIEVDDPTSGRSKTRTHKRKGASGATHKARAAPPKPRVSVAGRRKQYKIRGPDVPLPDGSLAPTRDTSDIRLLMSIPLDKNAVPPDTRQKCNICKRTWALKSTSGTLRDHCIYEHKETYLKLCEEHGWQRRLQEAKRKLDIKFGAAKTPGADTPAVEYSPEGFLDHLVRFISAGDQALRIVEVPEFRSLLRFLRPSLEDKDIPRRTKMRHSVAKSFKQVYTEIREELKSAAGKISITTDLWTNLKKKSNMAVTGHYLKRHVDPLPPHASRLVLCTSLIGFRRITGGHDGKSLAEDLYFILDRAGIKKRLGHITMDNASVNDTMIKELAVLLKQIDNITYDPREHRIMCLPHVVHIATSHILNKFFPRRRRGVPSGSPGSSDASDSEEEFAEYDVEEMDEEDEAEVANIPPPPPGGDATDETYQEAVDRNPLAIIRGLIRDIRASGSRHSAFEGHLQKGVQEGWFRDSEGTVITEITATELLRDVPTRWDSTFLMLERARNLRSVIDHFSRLPDNDYLEKYRLTPVEWVVLIDLEDVLSTPHEFLHWMARENTPTLCSSLKFMEMWQTAWESHQTLVLSTRVAVHAWIEEGLKWAKKYYSKMDNSKAFAVSMFLNPGSRFRWIETYWEEEYIEQAREDILSVMHRYRTRLVAKRKQSRSSKEAAPADPRPADPNPTQAGPSQLVGPAPALGRTNLQQRKGLIRMLPNPSGEMRIDDGFTQSVESEFHAYSTLSPEGEAQLAQYGDIDLRLLDFWENKRSVYPTLYAMALDYLPIQASSVPCERIFSSSGVTDTKRRNRISPILFETLQILKHWYRKDRIRFFDRWIVEYTEMTAKVADPTTHQLEDFLNAKGDDKQMKLAIDAFTAAITLEEGAEDPVWDLE